MADVAAEVSADPTAALVVNTDSDSAFYWEGAGAGRLLAQRCSACDRLWHPPGPACPYCHSLHFAIDDLPLEGVLYSVAKVHEPGSPIQGRHYLSGSSMSPTRAARGRACAGQTEFSVCSGRSERPLAVEAITAALDDAGLSVADVDGLVAFDADSNDPASLAASLGLPPLSFFASTLYGCGGGGATIMHAAMAVASGAAEVVVAFRAMNERSGVRYGRAAPAPRAVHPALAYSAPYGIHTAAQLFAFNIARYFHEHGVSNADVAPVAVAQRAHAATNPAARFYQRPITIDDHQSSRWIVEPVLRLLDCCLESDGAVALVVTSADRARTLPHAPVRVVAVSQGLAGAPMRNWYRPSISGAEEVRVAAARLWASSALGPGDVQLAILYDHFLPLVLTQLEAFGFCPEGEAKHFVADGGISVDGGRLPVNTHGGLTGEAYLHGMNGIAEAVRQLRRRDDRRARRSARRRAHHRPRVPGGDRPTATRVTINTRTERGRELLGRLIAASDVVTENFSAGVLESWGFTYERMRELRADVIYASNSGFGPTRSSRSPVCRRTTTG